MIATLHKKFLGDALSEPILRSLVNPDVPGYKESPTGCSPAEVFQCLAILATNRDNALELVKLGIVSKCETFLEFAIELPFLEIDNNLHGVTNATQWTLRLLFNLKAALPEISDLFTFEELLFTFKRHSNEAVKQITCDLISLIWFGFEKSKSEFI